VDALREYNQPVFVYIPPGGELRGGAWVVVDPTINEQMMEMYADVEARGGILEPPGICEVKYRKGDQIKLMHRLDAQLIELSKDKEANAAAIEAREGTLLPVYLQIAHEFADLHDRAGRMEAKGVIRQALEWKNARKFFFHRMVRRLQEDKARDTLMAADATMTFEAASAELEAMGGAAFNDDEAMGALLLQSQDKIDARAKEIKRERVKVQLAELLSGMDAADRKSVMDGL